MGNQSRISHQGETWPDLSLEITGCSWKNGLEEAVGCREMNIFQIFGGGQDSMNWFGEEESEVTPELVGQNQ